MHKQFADQRQKTAKYITVVTVCICLYGISGFFGSSPQLCCRNGESCDPWYFNLVLNLQINPCKKGIH